MSRLYLRAVEEAEFIDGIETSTYDIVVPEIHRVVGRIEFRNEFGIDLKYYGHVGYVVYPPYRGHRYAYQACLKLFEILKPKRDWVYITCNPDNISSKKTIERLNATFIETLDVDPHHELYEQGDVQKDLYKVLI